VKWYNVWKIKNRWLRAGVAWVAAALCIVGLPFAVVIDALAVIIVSIVGEAKFYCRDTWADIKHTARYAWAAMTAKDIPDETR
jgi:hypothetical protein